MTRAAYPAGLLAVAALTIGCGGGDGGSPAEPQAPTAGSIQVTTSTAGNNPDPDGFSVNLDGSRSREVEVEGSVTFSDVSPGSHSVELAGLAANCAADDNPRSVDVTAGRTARVSFQVNCPGGSISGEIRVASGLLVTGAASVAAVRRRAPSRRRAAAPAAQPSPVGPPPRAPLHTRPRRTTYAPGELIVTFHSSALPGAAAGARTLATPSAARRVAASMRARLEPYERRGLLEGGLSLPFTRSTRVRIPDDRDPEAVMAELRADPAVRSVRRNALVRNVRVRNANSPAGSRSAPVRPDDPLFPWQAWGHAMADVPRAWDVTTGSPSVVVAVVDDGITEHPDVAPNLTSDGYDFVSDFQVPFCDGGGAIGNAGDGDGPDPDPTQPTHYTWNDADGCVDEIAESGNHGLKVAAVIGAVGDDAFGVAGVSWQVRIRPVRVMGVSGMGTAFDAAVGISYAGGFAVALDDGSVAQAPPADVINLSIGGFPDDPDLVTAVAEAEAAGVTLIAAAGNDGSASDIYPAAFPEVLSVGALNPVGERAPYSNFAPSVEAWAPGGQLFDGESFLGLDFGVITAARDYVAGEFVWVADQGTSFAAPYVSGIAALILALEPGLPPAEVRRRLLDYAVETGVGKLVNARNSLTRSLAPPTTLYARLVDAGSGATVTTVQADEEGGYAFSDVAPGDYYVYGGLDEDGDGRTGVPGRVWGAFDGAATPTTVSVVGSGQATASFEVGLPAEAEPNDDPGGANFLAVDGYLVGTLPGGDADVYRVRAGAQGTYTLETVGVAGACGFALEEDTTLRLLSADGVELARSEDIDPNSNDFCARIETTLAPGDYFLRVESADGGEGGRYAVAAHRGP